MCVAGSTASDTRLKNIGSLASHARRESVAFHQRRSGTVLAAEGMQAVVEGGIQTGVAFFAPESVRLSRRFN